MSQPAAADENKGPEIGEMKKGDYQIHVFLQSGKQFKSLKGDLVQPMIEVTCCGKKKYSSSKSDVTSASTVYWGEHVFFEPTNMSRNDIENSQIQIRVLNKSFFKDELLGVYEFDVTFVYFQPKHALFHQWVALSNPESKEFNEISCYLKLSISITGPGDEQVSLNESSLPDSTSETEVMMPPSIKKEFKQIKFRFVKGEKLPKMDAFGTIDAYIQTTFMKKKMKTKVVTQTKDTQETFIEQELWLPVQWPMATDRLVLKVYDQDNVADEIVGSMNFSLKSIINNCGPEGMLVWKNLYGSPLGCSGKNTDLMNENPEIASTWKGRILMQISSFEVKNPEMKVIPLETEFKNQITAAGAFDYTDFEIIAEVGAGICLPGKRKYHVRISIGDYFIETTDPKESKEKYCRWGQRFEATTFRLPYKSVEEMDQVYVYLMDGSEAICFWKGPASQFKDPNPKPKWLAMTNDLAKGKVQKSYEAGLISVKMSLNHKAKNGPADFKKQDAWKKPPPKRLGSWKIRCFIFQCKDVPAADSDGQSDPYVSIWNSDAKDIKTQVVDDNVNPIFFEALEIYYDYDSLNDAPPVVLNLWDKDEDLLDSTDDYLGRCVVYLDKAAISNNDTIPVPRWHDIKIGFNDNDPSCGQMLVSFSVVPDDFVHKIPISYLKLTDEIQYKDYDVEINVLGLRQLESFGLMPVKKPFIRFNLRSLLPPSKAQAVTNIKTQPSSTGSNPNINTMINFAIDLPVDPLFCPKLACDVYDYIFKGYVQPLLGTFSLAIGDIMQEERQEKIDQIKQSERITELLKNRVAQAGNFVRGAQTNLKAIGDNQLVTQGRDTLENLVNQVNLEDTNVLSEGPLGVSNEFGFSDKLTGQVDTTTGGLMNSALKGEKSAFQEDEEIKSEPNSNNVSGSRSRSKTPLRGMSPQKTAGGKQLFKSISTALEMEQNVGFNIQNQIQKIKDQKKIDDLLKLEQQRQFDMQQLKRSNEEAHKNIIMPRYVYDERLRINREISKPPTTLYMELGYNEDHPKEPELEKKHYRRYYDDELENIKEIFPKMPFHTVDIVRGQSRGLSSSWFSLFSSANTDDSGENTNQKVVGKFKGRINIVNKEEEVNHKRAKEMGIKAVMELLQELHVGRFGLPLDFRLADLETFEKSMKFEHILEELGIDNMGILQFLKAQSYNEMITRQLLSKTKCMVRLYVLEGYDFAQRDIGSFSDPYLKIKCGSNKFNEREHYQLDEPNPRFYKMYEFDADFPGAAPITIKAYDYDDLFGDDLIGKTVIDLDDRFFCPEWQQIEDKPVEYRQLYHPSTSVSQGVVKLWLEIHMTNTSTKSATKVWDVTPQPVKDFELRVVVWDTKEVPCNSDVEGVSDVFLKVFMDDKDKKETDTHYRCQTGKASFNYRLLYQVKSPQPNYNINIQTWDRDLFKSNDFIGESQFSLAHLFEDAVATKQPMFLNKKYYDNFLKAKLAASPENPTALEFYDDDSFFVETKDSNGKYVGKVRVSISLVPSDMAVSNPVGYGRAEPNHSPFLPPPFGRLTFSLNPITMFNQMVGPELRRKIYCYCCLALCCVALLAMLPMIVSNVISSGILKIGS